jgi:putative ABC transport system substrate-binding protein
MPVVGIVRIAKRGDSTDMEDAFRKGLAQVGYVDNQNVILEWRYAEGDYQRLPSIMAELIDRKVAAIATLGAVATAIAAKGATQVIPIVFMIGADPIDFGLVASLAHPDAICREAA